MAAEIESDLAVISFMSTTSISLWLFAAMSPLDLMRAGGTTAGHEDEPLLILGFACVGLLATSLNLVVNRKGNQQKIRYCIEDIAEY